MSLGVHVSQWPTPGHQDEELRLCLDRGSDSDSQLELNQSLSELIESITCKEDSGDEAEVATGGRVTGAELVVADIVERLLDRVEAASGGAPRRASAELPEAREIDGASPSLEAGKSHHVDRDTFRRDVRRKRDHSAHKKSRRRSTSCSTTSSACSDISRKHHRKHKHHRRKEEDSTGTPRVNPIFLWVKQDDTRIVEVLCEDYDKRNRIRLTKTAHGWRATPRTERLDSALSRSSLDRSPTPPLVPEADPDLPKTKEKKAKRCVSRKNKRCDKKKDKGFKNENNYLDEYNNVDVVNNNNCSISNNNKIKVENRLVSEPPLSEPRLRSFGYKKACHDGVNVDSKNKKKDNKMVDEIDVYTFVPTPKTDSEEYGMEEDFVSESGIRLEVDMKSEPESEECELESDKRIPNLELKTITSEPIKTECLTQDTLNDGEVPTSSAPEQPESVVKNNDKPSSPPLDERCCPILQENIPESETENTTNEVAGKESDSQEEDDSPLSNPPSIKETVSQVPLEPGLLVLQSEKETSSKTHIEDSKHIFEEDIHTQQHTNTQNHIIDTKSPEPTVVDDVPSRNSSPSETKDESKVRENPEEEAEEVDNDEIEEEEEIPPEIILPEPHLQTPEPSPPPVPEPSNAEPESSLTVISLLPETSLDSDTIHLPDTTTKSETSLLINNDISLGQNLSIKPHSEMTALLTGSLLPVSKSQPNIQHSPGEMKTAAMLQQAELERQITADLDEDHLLAIEEILQGEECVEDFDDDDLPEEYPVTHESPVNLVIDLKAKDQVDNTGIPLSLRTDDFLEMFPTPLSLKEHSESLPTFIAPLKKHESVEKPIPPAHQQSKTKFLESILSCPKRCHKDSDKKVDSTDQQEPLYLGVSRKSASPTVSSSDGRKFSSPELEPKPKRMKVEDITLKTILNRNKESFSKTKVNKSKDQDDTQQTADSTTKSRLLELLTNENDEHINKLDPLTQLKEVLSDPDLIVPDPLLVPRARLPALVANPAKEIPRLLAMKSEHLLHPKLLTDPDLLVVSLSHLQSLLQAAGKEEEMLKYQQHAQLLQQQMKQEQSTLDAATATALNQMMWLPYLSQLEAAAMACGNTQDFMTMLNMVFPSGTYPQMNPYMMTPPSPGINAYDYKSQLEFQQAFALWNEAMMQAATNQFAAQNLGTTNTNNISSKLYQNYQEAKYNPKQSHSNHSNSLNKHQEAKHTSARTSPITLNYQQNKYRSSQYPYTSMFSIPTSTPTTSFSGSTGYRTTHSSQTQQTSSYQSSRQNGRGYNYSNYSSLRPPSVTASPSLPKSEPSINSSDLYKQQRLSNSSCKSLMNILSKPKQSEVKSQSHTSKVYPTSTTMLPKETTVRMTSSKQEPPKLKVKQPQHLVDPNSRPKLLNLDEHGEVGSTTGSLTPHVDEAHPNLWHPLFSSHQQKSSGYTSPWQWTTPVTVSGE